MATLLLNLRNVPDDEAGEVRALLEGHGIDYYETPPSFWGVSAGGLWLRDTARLDEARGLLARYQAERGERMRAARAAELREGRAPGTWAGIRAQNRVYVEYERTQEREYYDLGQDPHQLQNQATSASAATLEPLQGRLRSLRNCRGAGCR